MDRLAVLAVLSEPVSVKDDSLFHGKMQGMFCKEASDRTITCHQSSVLLANLVRFLTPWNRESFRHNREF
jgi:hypothetical protein